MKSSKGITMFLLTALLLTGCGESTGKSSAETTAETVLETQISFDATETVKQTKSVSQMKIKTTEKPKAISASEASDKQSETEDSKTEKKEDFDNFKKNVVIIGDSIALGYGAYERIPISHVFAKQSVSPSTIEGYTFDYNNGEASALSIMEELQPKYIMLSMGLNDITTYSAESFVEKYKNYIDKIFEVCSDTEVYIMGISPVMADCEYTSNEKIDEYNNKLSDFFKDYNSKIHFINAGAVLKNDCGSLNMEYSSGDGIHITGAAYDCLLEQLEKYLYK